MLLLSLLLLAGIAYSQKNPCIQTNNNVQYPCPPFPQQSQLSPGIEALMDPLPDWGYNTYNGSGKLRGKVALITGGDSGIGRAVALAFAREGANIVISYLNEDIDAKVVINAVMECGRQGIMIPGDISNETHIQYIINTTIKTFGKLDILVNNAATEAPYTEDISSFSRQRVVNSFTVNVIAPFDFVRYALPHMNAGGSIINTASVAAYNPIWNILDYSASKGALVTFTKGLAQYTITKGIRTNAIAPGAVWTPLIITSYPPEMTSILGETVDMGRPAQPAELAPLFVYLASEESSYTNGAVLGVHGGEFLP